MLRSSLTLLVLAGLALSSACTEAGEEAPPPTTERLGPAGQVPDGLAKFYGQALVWADCRPYATTDADREAMSGSSFQCARLTVPLDYSEPAGETITIGVLRNPAEEPERKIGSLVLNPGGPGVAGMPTAARLSAATDSSELGKRFDVVGFDPRGVGSSEPAVECLTDAERDQERTENDDVNASPSGVAAAEADQRDFVAKCVRRTELGKEFLAHVGTRDVVRDLDVLRSVLGDEKLTYLGYSYGTRIGSGYAEAFPDNVRALLLDGALDPEQEPVEELVAQAEGFQQAFDDFVAWCVRRDDCALGQDPDRAVAVFQGLVRPLIDNPIDVGDGRALSYSDATTGVTQALYADELWEALNSGLTELKNHRARTLMLLADTYLERAPDGTYSGTQDAFTAIRCVDDPRVASRAVMREAERRYLAAAPFLDPGTPPGGARDACAFWPVPNTSRPHLPEVSGLPPVLVISTTGDPATPYQAGVQLADALDGALLTYEATQHTVFLQGDACVDQIGINYLIDLKLPEEGARCPR